MHTIASPTLWAVTLLGLGVLFIADFLVTRRPHEVSFKEATAWSTFYVALPLGFGALLWWHYGSRPGSEFLTGYLVEKSLSVDNLFIFMLLLAAFSVPKALQQRVLLFGVLGALVMRAIMIAVGAQLLERFTFMFLIFGLVLLVTSVKVFRDARGGEEYAIEPGQLRSVRFLSRFFAITDGYHGTRMAVSEPDAAGRSRRALTPLAIVTMAVLTTDAVFATDSIPAVYGITGDPYLVFATNAFALMGLRALYFVLSGVLGKLVHLGYGLAVILAFIGYKLVAEWAHGRWHGIWIPSTVVSLSVIVGALTVVTITSMIATRSNEGDATKESTMDLVKK